VFSLFNRTFGHLNAGFEATLNTKKNISREMRVRKKAQIGVTRIASESELHSPDISEAIEHVIKSPLSGIVAEHFSLV
jgi:hypothetical protein